MDFKVEPQAKNIGEIFGIHRALDIYNIDFYQREYRWEEEHTVNQLIKDIFDAFEEKYESDGLKGEALEGKIEQEYQWYYLNTIILNKEKTDTYIVDGQQRLTTLLLMLIALYHISDKHDSQYKDRLEKLIRVKSENTHKFVINHETRGNKKLGEIFEHSCDAQTNQDDTTTPANLVKNYISIYNTLNSKLDPYLPRPHKLEAFTLYFLSNIVLISLKIDNYKDVPMVFEVINDRGERLKPYEVLKGKLLGKIADKKEILKDNGYNEKWDKRIGDLLKRERDIDLFFEHFLTARYSQSQNDRDEYFAQSDYQKGVYRSMSKGNPLPFSDQDEIKDFLDNIFPYYVQLYLDLIQDREEEDSTPAVFYNHLSGMDNNQFLLVMAGIALHDKERETKIKVISEELDRLRVLLGLQNVYDSRNFSNDTYEVILKIRDKSIPEIQEFFDEHLLKTIRNAKDNQNIKSPFRFEYFRNTQIDGIFTKYFLARVDRYLNPDCRRRLYDWVRKRGFQIEHILSGNDKNKKPPVAEDEAQWEEHRNRLGALLLLKAPVNRELSDKEYRGRWKKYGESEFFWNKSLLLGISKEQLDRKYGEKESRRIRGELDKLREIGKNLPENFGCPANQKPFTIKDVEKRQKVLFEIAKIIWFPDRANKK